MGAPWRPSGHAAAALPPGFHKLQAVDGTRRSLTTLDAPPLAARPGLQRGHRELDAGRPFTFLGRRWALGSRLSALGSFYIKGPRCSPALGSLLLLMPLETRQQLTPPPPIPTGLRPPPHRAAASADGPGSA